MKEICWLAFCRLNTRDQRRVLMRVAGEFNGTALHLSSAVYVRRYLEQSPTNIIRFHAAVLDVVRQVRGQQAAELLENAMVIR